MAAGLAGGGEVLGHGLVRGMASGTKAFCTQSIHCVYRPVKGWFLQGDRGSSLPTAIAGLEKEIGAGAGRGHADVLENRCNDRKTASNLLPKKFLREVQKIPLCF
jgi:hypothetical protein